MYNTTTGVLYWIMEEFDGEWYCLFVLLWLLCDGAFAMGHPHAGSGIRLQISFYGAISSMESNGGIIFLVDCIILHCCKFTTNFLLILNKNNSANLLMNIYKFPIQLQL